MMKHLPEQHKELDAMLRTQGLCIVPVKSTKAMNSAAGNAMRKRKEAMGDDWFMIGNRAKAAIRWDAMIEAWQTVEVPSDDELRAMQERGEMPSDDELAKKYP